MRNNSPPRGDVRRGVRLDGPPRSDLRFHQISTTFLERDIAFENRRGRSHPRKTMNTAHAPGTLFFTVDHVVIRRIANGPERYRTDFRMHKSLVINAVPLFSAKRRIRIPTHRPNPARLVIAR